MLRRRGTRPPCRACSAVSTSASTSAAAPSETSEQSVRLSGPATNGFLSLSVRQNSIAEILAHLRVRIADAVLVVLGRDHGERVRLVAVFLEIESGDLAENAGKAALDLGLVAAHRTPSADCCRSRPAGVVVICSTPTTSTIRARLGRDRFQPLMHGGRAGGAGILDPGRALEAQIGRGLQHQRGGEILRREAGVEMAEHDLVHIGGRDAGIGERLGRTRTIRLSTVSVSSLPNGYGSSRRYRRSWVRFLGRAGRAAELWSLSWGSNTEWPVRNSVVPDLRLCVPGPFGLNKRHPTADG